MRIKLDIYDSIRYIFEYEYLILEYNDIILVFHYNFLIFKLQYTYLYCTWVKVFQLIL